MRFLLDTNVVSEWTKPRPDAGVVAWLSDIDESKVFLSVISLMALRYGVDCLPAGARRTRLDKWLQTQLPQRFEDRILPVDDRVAHLCGTLMARARAKGRSMPVMDAFIGATAVVHGLRLVTRNVSDFKLSVGAGMIVNPWTES